MEDFIKNLASVQTAVAALVGGAAGVATSLLGPWSDWAIERSRKRRDARATLLAEGELLAADAPAAVQDIAAHPTMVRLSPFLSDEFRRTFLRPSLDESGRPVNRVIVSSGGGLLLPVVLREELSRLERKWKLI